MLAAHTMAAIIAKLGSSNGGCPDPFPKLPFPGTNSSTTRSPVNLP